jgi:electron transfer flavoprotein alpha/beta subunit
MLAARKQITSWSASDLGLSGDALKPRLQHVRYFVPVRESKVEFITGETLEDACEKLAVRLREEKLI